MKVLIIAVTLLYSLTSPAQKLRIYKDSSGTLLEGEGISIARVCKALTRHFKHTLVITKDDQELHVESWVITTPLNALYPAMRAIELTNKVSFNIKNDTLYLSYRP